MSKFKIRFRKNELINFAERFNYESDDNILRIGLSAKEKGFINKKEFIEICKWKTPRSKQKVINNDSKYIEEITRVSFSTESDQLRIEILNLLNGVGWPTASAILHFCHELDFPVLDFRAIYSLGIDVPPSKYDYDFWKGYSDYCKKLSRDLGLSMRTIDKGLWQYSKENQ